MKTCLYNIDSLKLQGFTGVYIIFHISSQNIDCGYSLEPPWRGGFNEYPQSMFSSRVFNLNVLIFGGEYLNRRVFVMEDKPASSHKDQTTPKRLRTIGNENDLAVYYIFYRPEIFTLG